ncbi:uncharacterized protein PV09_04007 [Verruconis gallopava]|uniref:NmrA-like domain-containing protein n=1 Tax=Verruconis gallopava TaxID=253628 RepID=A0A0D2AD17_9PEZI|nr:uncharacterized protein PV09_04007 [Verruconis gallopava]KIW04823.1 hypothetical protein PV09_04007 [Verruconis gallopava]
MSQSPVLVLRGTGTQGRAVIQHLRKNNIPARAYVSNSKDERALAVRELGAELFEGTLDNLKALQDAMTGCVGLFLNQMPSIRDDTEVRQARAIIELARNVGVKHVVHSTSLGVPRAEELRQSGSIVAAAVVGKAHVEELVKAAGFEYWTIIRGGYFMSNFVGHLSRSMFPELWKEHKFVCSFKPDTLLPLVDPYDIGAFVTAAFSHPTKFTGKIIPLSKENIRVDQVVKDLEHASGERIEGVYRTEAETAELAKTNPMVSGAKELAELYKLADSEAAQGWGIVLHSLPQFLEREKSQFDGSFA